MLFDPQHTQYIFDEYERRVSAHLLEQAALKARAARGEAMAQLADRCLCLVTGLANRIWQWARSAAHWTLPSPGQSYDCAPIEKMAKTK